MLHIPPTDLKRLMRDAFTKLGVPENDAGFALRF